MKHCTIYSKKIDYSIIREIKQMFQSASVTIDGDEIYWNAITINEGSQALKISSKMRVQPGDEFSKIVMGSYTHFKKLPVRQPSFDKEALLKNLPKTEWLLGIVSEPGFDVESHERAILQITKQLGGFIFDGSAVLASNGDVLMGD